MARLLIVLISIYSISLLSQVRSDFILVADVRPGPQKASYDEKSRLHLVWPSLDIYHGIYDSLGMSLRKPVNLTETGNLSKLPRLAVSSNHVICVWAEHALSWNVLIFGRLLSTDGEVLSHVFRINDEFYDAVRGFPDVAFLNDSTFITVWSGDGPYIKLGSDGVFGQIINTNLDYSGNNFIVNKYDDIDNVDQRNCRVVVSQTAGTFLVLWQDDHTGTYQIYGRLYQIDGSPTDTSFLVSDYPNTTDARDVCAGVDKDGNYVVAWNEAIDSLRGIKWRRYYADGTVMGSIELLSENTISSISNICLDIGFDHDGTFLIAWEGEVSGILRITGQRFNADGIPVGGNFTISSLPDTIGHIRPAVALNGGNMFTVWEQQQVNPDRNLWANIYSFDDPPVNINPLSNPGLPDVEQPLAYPNPFNSQVIFRCHVSQTTFATLIIFNITGQKVFETVYSRLSPGEHKLRWNGSNTSGDAMPSGVYLYRLSGNNFNHTGKVVLIR